MIVHALPAVPVVNVALVGVNQATITGALVSSVTVNVPTEARDGDLLVAILSWRRGSSAPSVTSPAAWTDILKRELDNISMAAAYKVMAGDASVRFAGPSIAAASGAIFDIAAFRNFDPSAPILGYVDVGVTASGTTIDFPAMATAAPAGAGYYGQASVRSDAASRTMSWAAPMVELTDTVVASSSARSLGASSAFVAWDNAGTADEQVTLSSTQPIRQGILVGIKPAP